MFRNKVRAPELEEFGMRRNAKLPSLAKAMLSKLAECSGMHVAVGFMPAFKYRQKNSLIVLERGHKAHGYVSAGDASKIQIGYPPMRTRLSGTGDHLNWSRLLSRWNELHFDGQSLRFGELDRFSKRLKLLHDI